jgi:hypothetical protein
VARPKKQTVEYFPHYVSSGKTMFILENSFGNDGYAFWFKVLELLGMTDGHVYDCRNTADWEFLLAKTHVNEDLANKILKKLADLNAIDSELWKNRVIWSDNFVKNLTPVYNNRKAEIPKKPVINSRNDSAEGFLPVETKQENTETPCKEITTDKNTQSIVEESKVKESKDTTEKENKEKEHWISALEYFCQKSGKADVQLRPRELEAARKICTEVPSLDIVLKGIDKVFYDFKPDADSDKINSFRYCVGAIKDLWKRENIKRKGGKRHGSAGKNTESSPYDFSEFGG